jgi:dolichol-phosphate mannosyltransferase
MLFTEEWQQWVADGVSGMLSVVIPAHNEAGQIEATVMSLTERLTQAGIIHEILVVNDNSRDETEAILQRLALDYPGVIRYINNLPPNGFGFAVRRGLANFRGDVVTVVMADASDDPSDVVAFYNQIQAGYDCAFGSRFIRGGQAIEYPRYKLVCNRLGNLLVQILFCHPYNDFSNAFKMYRREVIAGVQPILSQHFNLTVELPLKAMIRGYRFSVLPNSWLNRSEGESKFVIGQMGPRYFFTLFYCLIERWFSVGDYARKSGSTPQISLSNYSHNVAPHTHTLSGH